MIFEIIVTILCSICFLPTIIYIILDNIKRYKIKRNNEKYKDGIDCPACGNKMQFVHMNIFNKSKDICNICGFKGYSFKLRRLKK